ncbi:MAG: hypothetical protein KAW12_00150 [Candidatus Aminicenantes bacterium]|nr:hypothetical protein [Candidatus Aminicenantes bacterium]
MKKIILSMLIFLLIMALPAAAKGSTLDPAIIPAGTQWLLHFDMGEFVSTRLYDLMMQKEGGKINKANLEFGEKLGVDLFKDIAAVTIFGTGKDKEKAVVCISGKLNKDHILSQLDKAKEHKQTPYGKYTLHSWKGDGAGAFVSDKLVLMGKDEQTIKDTLDVISGKKKNITKTKLMAHLKEMPSGAFFKAVADDISALAGNKRPVILQKTGMAFFLVLEKNADLNMKLKMTTDSPETAKNIEQVVNGLIAMAKMQKSEKQDLRWKLLEALTTTIKGNVVTMEFSYPSEQLVNMLEDRKGFNIGF